MTPANDVRPYGPNAFLITPGGRQRPLALATAIGAAARTDLLEIVAAAATVLVVVHDRASRDEVAEWLAGVAVGATGGSPVGDEREIVIDVVYDGADLEDVAAATGLDVSGVVERHAAATYRCEFCGFAPGFAYLGGLDDALVLPRRSTPRTVVPAGSVAIAGGYGAVYPNASPGGWHLLGRTDARLWDADAPHPALITPGATVRFRVVSELPSIRAPIVPKMGQSAPRSGSGKIGAQIGGTLRVVSAGWGTSLQDRGRPGYAAIGVPAAGALDAARLDLVNRLVGNDVDAAVIETAGGLVLEAETPLVIADSSTGAVRTMAPGDTADVDPREGEMWVYVALRGGIAVAPTLGSRSRDSLSALGPPPPVAGDVLAVGPDPRTPIATDQAPPPDTSRRSVLRVWPGPRLDWFADGSIEQLTTVPWIVSADVSRVGIRLTGPALRRAEHRAAHELPSEGLVTGAIQVPPDGQPVVMLADHPTTGGYPVIAVVDERDLSSVVQSRPGTSIRWREVTI